MKTLAILLFSLFMTKGCQNTTKNEIEAGIIEYVANSRGYYQKIKIENKTASFTKERSGKEIPKTVTLSDEDWKELLVLFQEINLEELENLKAPTEKRFYDGAAIAHLNVNYKGKEYLSSSFDHGFPPEQIEKIVNKINSFSKKYDEN
ncbi:hypothetical protein [Flavobacterium algicola]|uniref:hypothetical protein n=1 Tax=Flavobacterium algicola TaxID=556529 RepID=UPI001EFDBACA|nr:hypothetical protein [Flavobacterium algicola]MCG9792078.1 hypothetical protein [Flavobacterium algicola]